MVEVESKFDFINVYQIMFIMMVKAVAVVGHVMCWGIIQFSEGN
jgi:hypothetical protein